MKIVSFAKVIVFTFLLTSGTTFGAYKPNSNRRKTASAVNVQMLGAKGDGKSDDTAAFLKAIDKARAGSGIILVPRGQYIISQTLNLKELTLTGSGVGSWPADGGLLPSIIPLHRDGPAFILGKGSFLREIDIKYEWEKEPTNGPPAILINGVGTTVRDVRIRYAWDGISTDGKHNVGRMNIENVFMSSIRNVGVRISGSWDAPRLNNIEIWNTRKLKYGFLPGVGFYLGKNDMMRITDCFVFGMHCGFQFEEQTDPKKVKGGTWCVMNGCSTDFCTIGIMAHGRHRISISGGSFWNHEESLVVDGKKTRIRVTGSELKSNGAPIILIKSCDNATIVGCTLLRQMKSLNYPAVILSGGKVVFASNQLESSNEGVVIEPGLRCATITGNVIETTAGEPAIVDHRGKKSVIVIASNAIVTIPKATVKKVSK